MSSEKKSYKWHPCGCGSCEDVCKIHDGDYLRKRISQLEQELSNSQQHEVEVAGGLLKELSEAKKEIEELRTRSGKQWDVTSFCQTWSQWFSGRHDECPYCKIQSLKLQLSSHQAMLEKMASVLERISIPLAKDLGKETYNAWGRNELIQIINAKADFAQEALEEYQAMKKGAGK